ncbi:MAG: hypothetical protein M3Q48_13425 [Actinomycetota bacterium]|nr:hypothetical protein [Actinomycetota bacterium]
MPLLAVAAAGAVASLVMGIWAERWIRELSRETIIEPPARAVVCRGEVDATCAAEAVRRAHRTLAWVPADGDLRSRWFVVARPPAETGPVAEGRVFQELAVGDVIVEVATHPVDDLRNVRFVRAVDAVGVQGRLYHSTEAGGAYVVWNHAGEQFRVAASLLSLRRSWAEVERAALAAFRAVRYEDVPSSADRIDSLTR